MVTGDRRRSVTEIARQHASFQHDLESLTAAVTAVIAPPGGDQRALLRQVDSFHERLREHFQLEESGGYLTYVRKKRPGLTSFVDRLKGQHAEILSALASARPSPTSSPSRQVRVSLMRALDLLRRHELEESELIQRALSEDIGDAD
jgi:hypothetical protein